MRLLAALNSSRLSASGVDCSETCDFLDENCHLVLFDGAGVVLVELTEASVEVGLGELARVVHFAEGVLHELLGLFFIKGAGVVLVVFVPNIVNALSDYCLNVRHIFFFFGNIINLLTNCNDLN